MQTGARGVRRGAKRCKKVQVQVLIRLKRFRCTGAPAGSANSYDFDGVVDSSGYLLIDPKPK